MPTLLPGCPHLSLDAPGPPLGCPFPGVLRLPTGVFMVLPVCTPLSWCPMNPLWGIRTAPGGALAASCVPIPLSRSAVYPDRVPMLHPGTPWGTCTAPCVPIPPPSSPTHPPRVSKLLPGVPGIPPGVLMLFPAMPTPPSKCPMPTPGVPTCTLGCPCCSSGCLGSFLGGPWCSLRAHTSL